MRFFIFISLLIFLAGCAKNKEIFNSYYSEKIPLEEQYWNLNIEVYDDSTKSNVSYTQVVQDKDTPANKPVSLGQKYPNPFWPTTTIHFEVFEASNIDLIIFDIEGRIIGSASTYAEKPGKYVAKSNGVNLNSGIYFYIIKYNGTGIERKKMIYLK